MVAPSIVRAALTQAIVPDRAPGDPKALAACLADPQIQDRLIDLAVTEGLVGLLYDACKRRDLVQRFSPAGQRRLQRCYHQILAGNLKLTADLAKVLAASDRSGVPVVVLQGMALLAEIYPAFGLRPVGDIDLWVPPAHFPQLTRMLAELGYRTVDRYPTAYRRGPTRLDVNTHLLWADRIRARKWLLTTGQATVYHNCRQVCIQGIPARLLDMHDQVIYLAMHLLKHNGARLIWLLDIQRIVARWQAPEWRQLVERARFLGQEKAVGHICYLLDRLLDFRPSGPIRHRLQPIAPDALERYLLAQRVRTGALPVWANLVLLRPQGHPIRTALYVWETLMPDRAVLEQIFGNSAEQRAGLLGVRRMGQLGKLAVQALTGAFRNGFRIRS